MSRQNVEDEVVVDKIIINIKSKACSTDGINIDLIKRCCPFLLPYLAHIMSFCTAHSVFPSSWKIATLHCTKNSQSSRL